MSNPVQQWVTLRQIAEKAGRNYNYLTSLAKRGLIKGLTKEPGIQGYRLTVTNANRFLSKHWPGTELFPEP